MAQNPTSDLPYRELTTPTAAYSGPEVAARMIDGLGFRYYWASEGLTEKDLAYQSSDGARTSRQTLEHIYDLCTVIRNAVEEKPNTGQKVPEMTFDELRANTLNTLAHCAELVRKSNNLEPYKIVFKRGEKSTEFPFWNLINGPISDALWHCGQVVSMRRASGNPFTNKVSVLTGKLRE